MKHHIIFLFILLPFCSKAQPAAKQEMHYDAENALYWKITNDQENLYIQLYKDEYAHKVREFGGIRIFINTDGKRDTTNVPIIQYPLYKKNLDLEVMGIYNIKNIPDGEVSVYNEFGILAEGKFEEKEGTTTKQKDHYIYISTITIPLQHIQSSGSKLAIQLLLKGFRTKALRTGGVSPILIGTPVPAPEIRDFILALDTWTHCWIDYALQ